MGCIYNYFYGCPRQKNSNLTDILQHPAVVSMIIAIRLLPIHSPKDTISIAFLNQRHHIIMYIPKQRSAVPAVASNIIQHYESFISRRGLILVVVYTLHQNNTIIVSNVVSNNLRHLYYLMSNSTGCSAVSNILEHRLVLDAYILSYSCHQ